ncbi:MAG TPA: hypothetical protein DEU93_10695, partial [Chitinophagaceae bacterium]|nr:hypothetical protein [Chitinophagaceae bacterium]HML59152.1 hypothetical protein [Ferruginibacter sp.]
MDYIQWVMLVAGILIGIYLIVRLRQLPSHTNLQQLKEEFSRFQYEVRDGFRISREESMNVSRMNREELFNMLRKYDE